MARRALDRCGPVNESISVSLSIGHAHSLQIYPNYIAVYLTLYHTWACAKPCQKSFTVYLQASTVIFAWVGTRILITLSKWTGCMYTCYSSHFIKDVSNFKSNVVFLFHSSVGAGRTPHRQMRRYLPCGEWLWCLLASGEDKNEMFPHYFWRAVFAVKIAAKTTALPSFFSDINIALFDFLNSQSISASPNFADLKI